MTRPSSGTTYEASLRMELQVMAQVTAAADLVRQNSGGLGSAGRRALLMREPAGERRTHPKEMDIMLVQDDPNDVELTLHLFRRCGVSNRVRVVRDGGEAMDILVGGDGLTTELPPKLILIDVQLPSIDWLDVLDGIRAQDRTRCAPVVLLTSSDAESNRLRDCVRGADGYLAKPLIDPGVFIDLALQLSLSWLYLKRPA